MGDLLDEPIAKLYVCDEDGERTIPVKIVDVDLSEAEIEGETDKIALNVQKLYEPISIEAKCPGLRLLTLGYRATLMLQERFDRKHRI